jgi:hypothetical protein
MPLHEEAGAAFVMFVLVCFPGKGDNHRIGRLAYKFTIFQGAGQRFDTIKMASTE